MLGCVREGPNVDGPSLPGRQCRGKGAVLHRNPAWGRSALPGAAPEASVRGAHRPAPAISEPGHGAHARAPRQAVALAPRALGAPSAGCWCVPTPEDYDSHDATRGRAALITGKPRRRGSSSGACCMLGIVVL